MMTAAFPGVTEIQAGSYIVMDAGILDSSRSSSLLSRWRPQ